MQIMVVKWSSQSQDTSEFDPVESMETAGVRPRVLTRQPESTTEELADGDQAICQMLGSVCEESENPQGTRG